MTRGEGGSGPEATVSFQSFLLPLEGYRLYKEGEGREARYLLHFERTNKELRWLAMNKLLALLTRLSQLSGGDEY